MPLPIYTFDVETDPFSHGRVPEAFACEVYGVDFAESFWGKDCIKDMMLFIEQLTPGILYAHNGGRFDFFYIMDWILGSDMRIIGSRIINAKIQCLYGEHDLRDSFAIMPFALSKFKGEDGIKKREIDICKLERKVRKKHKKEIMEYLHMDCVVLHLLVSRFSQSFGSKTLTIGTASMRELKKVHDFKCLDSAGDKDLRELYYYGGRVECFEQGIVYPKAGKKFKVYDLNSAYPFAMKSYQHPIDTATHEGTKIEPSTMFISVTGKNYGAFPSIVKGGLRFDVDYGTFHVTRHEWDVAMEFGLFEPDRIERCVNYEGRTATFETFVDKFYNLRLDAKLNKDEVMALFYKFIMNSAYGKFGQNPENYKEFTITDSKHATRIGMIQNGWELESVEHGDKYSVWSKPTKDANRFNVATGASITGAVRSILLRGIHSAKQPLYCDTDSLLCSNLPLKLDNDALGAWKLECECDSAAIAGRKLYALFDGEECVKQANKGVNVTPIDIWNICCGDVIQTQRDAPSYKLDGSHVFIKRRVRMTGKKLTPMIAANKLS